MQGLRWGVGLIDLLGACRAYCQGGLALGVPSLRLAAFAGV